MCLDCRIKINNSDDVILGRGIFSVMMIDDEGVRNVVDDV